MVEIGIPEELIENTAEDKTVQCHVPISVAGAIAPWNYPVLLATSKFIPVIYTGKIVILKSSPYTTHTPV